MQTTLGDGRCRVLSNMQTRSTTAKQTERNHPRVPVIRSCPSPASLPSSSPSAVLRWVPSWTGTRAPSSASDHQMTGRLAPPRAVLSCDTPPGSPVRDVTCSIGPHARPRMRPFRGARPGRCGIRGTGFESDFRRPSTRRDRQGGSDGCNVS